MTVSSNPTRAPKATLPGSPTACCAIGEIAAHRACQPTPSLRAGDATDPSTSPSLPAAHSPARQVSTRRGPARPDCSVHVLASHSESGHAQTRLFHNTLTGTDPAAPASRNTTGRRPLDRALTPQPAQNTACPPGDSTSTSTTNSPASTRSATTANPNTPKPTTEPA